MQKLVGCYSQSKEKNKVLDKQRKSIKSKIHSLQHVLKIARNEKEVKEIEYKIEKLSKYLDGGD